MLAKNDMALLAALQKLAIEIFPRFSQEVETFIGYLLEFYNQFGE